MPEHDSDNRVDRRHHAGHVSTNDLTQSTIGFDRRTGERLFVKTPNPGCELGPALQDAVLSESLRCQNKLRHPRIVTAKQWHRDSGRLTIEYAYLDPAVWRPLDAARFVRDWKHILPEIAVLVDYLHHLGLVHCDLKLSNFMIGGRDDGELRLIDLDFLCPAGTRLKARVLGTPELIPPEIERNDEVYRQSDHFSLGKAIARAVKGEGGLGPDDQPAMDRLVEAMTLDDPLLRPNSLAAAIEKAGLIDAAERGDLDRRILAMLLLTRFRRGDPELFGDETRLTGFFAEARIIGLDRGLIALLATAWSANRRATFRLFRDYFAGCAVQQAAGTWVVTAADRATRNLFDALGRIARRSDWPPEPDSSGGSAGLSAVLDWAGRLASARQLLWGYLGVKHAVESVRREDVPDLATVGPALEWLGETAAGLNRLPESLEVRLALYDLLPENDERRFPLLYQVARMYYMTFQPVETKKVLKRLLEQAEREGDVTRQVSVRRMMIMARMEFGEKFDVDELVRSTITAVQDVLDPVDLAMSHYAVGGLLFQQGKSEAARDHLLKAIALCRQAGNMDRLLLALPALSASYGELGEYRRGYHWARVGLRLARRRGNTAWLAAFMSPLIFLSVRMGRLEECEYWISRFESELLRQLSDVSLLAAYRTQIGYGRLQAGRLDEGRAILFEARSLHQLGGGNQRDLSAVYHSLAECALWQGEADQCDEFADRALDISRKIGNGGAALEIELVRVLNDRYNRGDDGVVELHALLGRLVEHRAVYYALLCAYHLLLLDEANRDRVIAGIAPIRKVLTESPVPLFRALIALLPVYESGRLDPTALLRGLKEAYQIFSKGGQRFLAAITVQKIADIYLADRRDALGRTYLALLEQAATAIGNPSLAARSRSRIHQLKAAGDSHRSLVNSIHGISEVIRDAADYEQALARLVEFAVNETGAERGALLLKNPVKGDLYVAAYYNCDEGSLGDITEISSRVPVDASQQIEPLIIDNATADDRTREYQSVVRHNILSVVCVPIMQDGANIGALYLDHHMITALFEKDDITYITAIANFMAVVLSALREVRDVTIINRELTAELGRSDNAGAFLTADPVTLDLLKDLSAIARSDHPVLILGESGTGKGVLARRIHHISRRGDKPFVRCGSAELAESIVDSELFGVAKGAATGVVERPGKFEISDGGTLFFDEIGDMPLAIQAKVLNAVEEHHIQRVGSNRTIWVDTRLIYATNRDLQGMVKRKEFRLDLFQRIATFIIEIPPLRQRRCDIPLLVDHFIRVKSKGVAAPRISRASMDALQAHDWPGNVRELETCIDRLCALFPGQEIGVNRLPREIMTARKNGVYAQERVEADKRAQVAGAWEESRHNYVRGARIMGVPRTTFRRWVKRYGLDK